MWSQQYPVTFLKPNFIRENWDTEVMDLLKVAVTTFLPVLPLMVIVPCVCYRRCGEQDNWFKQFQVKFPLYLVLKLNLALELWAESDCQSCQSPTLVQRLGPRPPGASLQDTPLGMSCSAACSQSSPVGSKAVASRDKAKCWYRETSGAGLDSGHFLIKILFPFQPTHF